MTVGQAPPLDFLAAQAEVAANQEQLIVAEAGERLVEDRLRLLIFDATDRSVWSVRLNPVDSPAVGTTPLDVDAAVTNALKDRADSDPRAAGHQERRTARSRWPETPACPMCG